MDNEDTTDNKIIVKQKRGRKKKLRTFVFRSSAEVVGCRKNSIVMVTIDWTRYKLADLNNSYTAAIVICI